MESLDTNRFDRPLLNEYDIVPGFHDLEDAPEALDYDIAHLYVSCLVQWPLASRLTQDIGS